MVEVERPRAETQLIAAQQLGVSARILRGWENEPWWRSEFRTTEGYWVGGIRPAAEKAGRGKKPKKSESQVNLESAKLQAEVDIKQAELRKRLRAEQEELGNILPRDEYETFARELLGMIRSQIEDLPRWLAKRTPEELRPLIFHEDEPTQFQREIDKRCRRISKWLDEGPGAT